MEIFLDSLRLAYRSSDTPSYKRFGKLTLICGYFPSKIEYSAKEHPKDPSKAYNLASGHLGITFGN